MKANINNDDYLIDGASVTEPHFDDERTLLAAQPVVPLKKVKAHEVRARRGAFGLAIFCSLLVGFLSGTALYRRGQNHPAEVVSAAVPGATGGNGDEATAIPSIDAGSALDSGTGSLAEAAPSTAAPSESSTTTVAVIAKVPALNKAKAARTVARAKQHAKRDKRNEVRARRVEPGGAFRITEIFEGAHRP